VPLLVPRCTGLGQPPIIPRSRPALGAAKFHLDCASATTARCESALALHRFGMAMAVMAATGGARRAPDKHPSMSSDGNLTPLGHQAPTAETSGPGLASCNSALLGRRARFKANPIGQGWWIQAEFGSGKSHAIDGHLQPVATGVGPAAR
jgi:hypothetical protein